MAAPVTYRTRLRFRLQKKLSIDAPEHRLRVAGREVVLSAPEPDQKIADSEWLILNTRGLETEEQAREFGHRLRAALEVSSVATRLGVDAGRDVATAGLGAAFREHLERTTGRYLRDNVHGVDVFADEPHVGIVNFSATGVVRAQPAPFLSDLDALYAGPLDASPRTRDIILLLNTALMQPNPVAQIVFSFSAVEMLGQEETWSTDQQELLSELAACATRSPRASAAERAEVADAIRRSIHRLTLRQGVLRLLATLDLANLKPVWDGLYAERSALVHGLAPQPGADYGGLAHRAVNLCGRILLAAVAREIPAANRYVDRFYA